MNLREQLKEILPNCLPHTPGEAVKGTELIKIVRHQLKHQYSDATLRYHFSVMSCDPASPIAKVDQGQGYYLRHHPPVAVRESQPPLLRRDDGGLAVTPEEVRRWNLFQAVFEVCSESGNRFVFPVEPPPGALYDSPWFAPDAVTLDWKAGELTDGGYHLKRELLSVVERPFELSSVRLALEATHDTLHELVFQALSAGSWANRAELVIAAPVLDEGLADELRHLGNRYGVGITSFGLPAEQLDSWESPSEIRDLAPAEIESLQGSVTPRRIAAPLTPWSPDLDRLADLREKLPPFSELFQWIHRCMLDCQAYSLDSFRQLS